VWIPGKVATIRSTALIGLPMMIMTGLPGNFMGDDWDSLSMNDFLSHEIT
jgi:hypothetical protein